MTIDFKQLAGRLAKPWWGPYAPCEYVMEHKGAWVGVGRIVGQDYGSWNMLLLSRGSYHTPTTIAEHNLLLASYVQAKQVAANEVKGQPLGSYLMLLSPAEFREWLGLAESEALGPVRKQLMAWADRLMAVPTE